MVKNKKAKNEKPQRKSTTSKRKRAAADKTAASAKESLPAGLAQPALRALAGAGITSLSHFTRVTEAELLSLHGMGPNAIKIIRSAMKANRLSFSK